MAVLSALRLVFRRALLNRRAKDVLLDTLGCSAWPRPAPEAAPLSVAIVVSATFPSVTILDDESSLPLVFGESNLPLTLGESSLPLVPGAGKLLKSGSYDVGCVMLAWKSSKLTEGRNSGSPGVSSRSRDSSRVWEKLNRGLLPVAMDWPRGCSLVDVGRYDGRWAATWDSLVTLGERLAHQSVETRISRHTCCFAEGVVLAAVPCCPSA
jgi:hypothetical protein